VCQQGEDLHKEADRTKQYSVRDYMSQSDTTVKRKRKSEIHPL